MNTRKAQIKAIRPAGDNCQVVTVVSTGTDKAVYRRKPCPKCPWRKDAVGEFPAEAFKHSASTAYDLSQSVFSCHDSGLKKPATCAGFLLRGADNNLSVRLGLTFGTYAQDVTDGGVELHDSYRAMAIANGVPAEDESLKLCRD